MKTCCCIGLCLLWIGNITALDWPEYEEFSGEDIAHLRQTLQNPKETKEFLIDEFVAEHSLWPDEIPLFKQKFDVRDEIIRPVLLDILRESAQKTGWEMPPSRNDDPADVFDDKRRLLKSIVWLGTFADEPAKKILSDIAADDAKDRYYRDLAVQAYLYCADAQEVKDILMRYIEEKGRDWKNISWSPLYAFAEGAYRATTDEAKREAILAVLYVVMAQEENKDTFSYRDKKLAHMSKEYATSSQRLTMLKRISKLPPSKGRDTDNDLNAALESYKSRKTFTSVSTNLTELMARDFRKPTRKGGQ